MFRVEGEGIFLTKRGMVQHGANSRIFSGPGGSVIESPNILKLMVPPEEEEKPVKFKRPAVLCLNVGDASRAETYYAQKLLQYREAAEKLRNDTDAATSKFEPFLFCMCSMMPSLLSLSPYGIPLQDQIIPHPEQRRGTYVSRCSSRR